MSQYIIFIETISGEIIRAFTWSGNLEDGINRAKAEARERNISPLKVYGESISKA